MNVYSNIVWWIGKQKFKIFSFASAQFDSYEYQQNNGEVRTAIVFILSYIFNNMTEAENHISPVYSFLEYQIIVVYVLEHRTVLRIKKKYFC